LRYIFNRDLRDLLPFRSHLTLTFNLVIVKIDRFLLLSRRPFVTVCIKISSSVFKISY